MPHASPPPFRWPLRLALLSAAACVILWLISLRKTVIIGLSGYGLMLTDGGLWLIHRRDFERREFALTDATGRLDWWPPFGHIREIGWRPGWSLDVRLWFIAAAALSLAGVIILARRIRTARRIRAGRCTACNFDRRGTPPAAPCPECGAAR